MNISQGLLPFQLIQDTSKVLLTSFGGLPLVMGTFRALTFPQAIKKHLPLLRRPSEYREADYVESFVSVFAAGGDCVDDFEMLRADKGLKKLGLEGSRIQRGRGSSQPFSLPDLNVSASPGLTLSGAEQTNLPLIINFVKVRRWTVEC